jgi:Bacterial dnaA protein helix-turn-helix
MEIQDKEGFEAEVIPVYRSVSRTMCQAACTVFTDFYGSEEYSLGNCPPVTVDKILSPSRKQYYVYPRQVLMYLLTHDLERSFPEAGTFMHRHHSTVMYGKNCVEEMLMKQDAELIELLTRIRSVYRALMQI